MTTDTLVVDVSRDWALACDVQQRFMQGLLEQRAVVRQIPPSTACIV